MADEHETPELVNVPPDLALVGDEDLRALETSAVAEFDAVSAQPVTAESVQHAMRLTDDIARVRGELVVRQQRAEAEAERQQAELAERMATLNAKVRGPADGDEPAAPSPAGKPAPAAIDVEAIAAAAARGVAVAMATLGDRKAGGAGTGAEVARRITTSLAEAARHAPEPHVPRTPLVVTASVDIPGVAAGEQLTFDRLVESVQRRAKALPIGTSGDPMAGPRVATVRNQFEHTLDDRTSLAQSEELVRYLTSKDKQDALVAGGGWCAPSEIRYDFFEVACEDGLVDLPTFGVSRGGVQIPVSPSLADVTPTGVFGGFSTPFSATSNPWLWTETDDQATVTGTPNKPCVRVPCATHTNYRLECYGMCLTAGNLTDDAWPEATQNFLRLLVSAHSHAMNGRFLATMAQLSTGPVTGGEFAAQDAPVFQQVLGGISLAAADYRARYGMCMDDVLEVIIPQWVVETIQADLAWRTGVDMLSVTRAQIVSYFADRNVRPQFVGDWQVRGTGQFGNATAMTAWPTSVEVMIYAAGTFLLGNGLTLDLGVVRDSVLNAENDHTAAWSEECHLVARVGHESRRYVITFNVSGATSQAAVTVDAFPNL